MNIPKHMKVKPTQARGPSVSGAVAAGGISGRAMSSFAIGTARFGYGIAAA